MGAGAFIRGADGFGCRHCDYRRACPEAEIEAALSKTDDSNPGVAALKRLAEYE
jgi:hypothetical protein